MDAEECGAQEGNKSNRMKTRLRPKNGSLPLLLAVPVASLSLLTLPSATLAQAETPAQNAQNQPPPVVGNVISEIIVTGNKVLNSESIIIASRHNVGDPCTQQVLLEMQENIARTGNFGFRSAGSIEEAVKITATEQNGKCKVEIQVDENPKIENVDVQGSGPIKPEVISNLVTKTPVFNYKQFAQDADKIVQLYTDKGYQAAVTQDSEPTPEGILKVSILVTRVGEIKVSGNRKTRRRVILREMQTKEGGFYNTNTLREDLRNLYNLQLFEDVTPSITDKGAGVVGITVNVPERRTGQVLVGVGFSNRAQLIGTAELSDTNFQGTGRAVSLQWQTGGAVGRSSIVFNFAEPWLDKKRTRLNVSLYDRIVYRFSNNLTNVTGNNNVIADDTRYNEQRTGATLTLQRPYGKQFVFSTTLRGENVRPDPLALTPGNAIILQNGPVAALGFSASRDTRDVFIDPISGGFQNINLEIGYANLKAVPVAAGQTAPPAFGSSSFLKSFFEVRQYFSLAGRRKKLDEQKSAIAVRAYFGTSAGRLPFFEQFFVGGSESLRGYREDRFWGRNVLLGSLEFRQPIARSLKGVLFFDVATAWGGDFQGVQIEGFNQSGFSPHGAVGLGLRVGSPLGLIRLDYGYGSEGGRTHISIGQVF